MFEMVENRVGVSMRIKGMKVNRPEAEFIATDLGINLRDVTVVNGVLTVYITSPQCQKIVDENSLKMYVALSLDIPVENISDVVE